MAKKDPSALNGPESIKETREFDLGGGEKWKLTLEATGDALWDFALEGLRLDLVETYVAGKEDSGPTPLAPIDGKPVKVSSLICRAIATLMLLEVPEEGEQPYDFYEWLQWARKRSKAFSEAVIWSTELVQRARALDPNAPKALEV